MPALTDTENGAPSGAWCSISRKSSSRRSTRRATDRSEAANRARPSRASARSRTGFAQRRGLPMRALRSRVAGRLGRRRGRGLSGMRLRPADLHELRELRLGRAPRVPRRDPGAGQSERPHQSLRALRSAPAPGVRAGEAAGQGPRRRREIRLRRPVQDLTPGRAGGAPVTLRGTTSPRVARAAARRGPEAPNSGRRAPSTGR